MKNIHTIFYNEFIYDKSIYEQLFLLTGILLQVIAFILTDDSYISLISGIAGIFSVILCSQKKISQFLFGFIQLGTYMILAWQQHFYGELIENIFYIITMIMGIFIWSKNYNDKNKNIDSNKLSAIQLSIITILTGIIIYILYRYLNITDDTQPFMDSISTVPAFTAQILLMLRYREQWLFWLIIDIASIFMWLIADNMIMVIQYIFWSINCIYGFKKWS